MKLEELLRKWSKLEPYRCEFSRGHEQGESWFTISLDSGKAYVEYQKATQEDHALLQAIVQKTIEKRGWLWSILFSAKGVYRAGVKISERYISETHRFPAHALLAAYLKAIEMHNTASQNPTPISFREQS